MSADNDSTTKFCVKCSVSKPLAEFYRDKGSPDGRRKDCKRCKGDATRQWRAENPEHPAAAAVRRFRNRENNRRRAAEWRAANPDKMRAGREACRAKKPEFYTLAAREGRKRLRALTPKPRWVAPAPVVEVFDKHCVECGRIKPLSCFYPRKDAQSGRRSRCSECERPLVKAWQAANVERREANRKAWRAANKDKQALYNRRAYNRDPAKRQASRERWKAKRREWMQANPECRRIHEAARRARLAAAPGDGWTMADVAAIHKAQKGKCALCRTKLGERFHRDHIKPLSKGGAHCRRNLQLTCDGCNLAKGARDPIDHARTLGLLL